MKFQFSGHETFPLRQLWLQKAYKYVHNHMINNPGRSQLFSGEKAMIELGVGKNMVSSLRFWALASGVLRRDQSYGYSMTEFGALLFGDLGNLDPYTENPATAWLVHWNLSSVPENLTVFWYIFNFINSPSISKLELQSNLSNFSKKNQLRISELTIKRDVDVCLRSYLPMLSARNKKMSEEFVEPLLGDLGILGTTVAIP